MTNTYYLEIGNGSDRASRGFTETARKTLENSIKDYKIALKKLEGKQFDLIFLDPPYKNECLNEVIDKIKIFSIELLLQIATKKDRFRL